MNTLLLIIECSYEKDYEKHRRTYDRSIKVVTLREKYLKYKLKI